MSSARLVSLASPTSPPSSLHKTPDFLTFHFSQRTHTTMKKTPTRLVPLRIPGCSTAATLGRVSCTVLFAVLILIGLVGRVAGQGLVPERLSFQGYMEDGSGTPLGAAAPVNYPVVFRIFPGTSGGTT